jgi:hypothetical protein
MFRPLPTPSSDQHLPARGTISVLYTLWDPILFTGGTRWRSWLRHCATSRKAAGSILHGVTGIFHLYNPSGRIMALGLTQPLTEMSIRNNNSWE